TRLAPAGLAATLLPISKNVALALFAAKMPTSRSVNGLGPSTKANATHLTCAQSTSSALANLTCPGNAPTATTTAPATTPATARQYRHAWVSGRLGTPAAYLLTKTASRPCEPPLRSPLRQRGSTDL